MRGRLRQILVAFLAAGSGAASAWANGTDDLTAGLAEWRRGHADEAVRLFTRAIEDGNLSKANQVLARMSRATALQSGGAYEEAIADYDTAIRLQPVPSLYHQRGVAYLAWGRLEDASEDFAQALALQRSNAHFALWLHVARLRAGAEDKREMMGNLARIDAGKWPGPLLAHLAGRETLEAAELAAQSPDPAAGPERRCDMAYFLGEQRLSDGDPESLRLLREARDICAPESPERTLARAALLRGGR